VILSGVKMVARVVALLPDNGSEWELEWYYKLSTAGGKMGKIPFFKKKKLQKQIQVKKFFIVNYLFFCIR